MTRVREDNRNVLAEVSVINSNSDKSIMIYWIKTTNYLFIDK